MIGTFLIKNRQIMQHKNDSQPDPASSREVLRPTLPVGLIGYGAYVPRYRLPGAEVARVWTNGLGGSPIKEKRWPGWTKT